MDEIFDRIKAIKIKRKYLIISLITTEIFGIIVLIWFLKTPLSQKFLTIPPKAYSVVSLNPQKRYLLSQGDFLTGKAIPNTKIKVLITPSFQKTQISSNSKGEWWYQIPADIPKDIHTITFGNFDKTNRLVTFQSYKFRIQSNISLLRLLESAWKKSTRLFSLKPASAQVMRSGFSPDLYANAGLPTPHIPITLTNEQRLRFREYFLPHAFTAARIVGADWRLMAMWTYKEDHITSFLDNCLDGNPKFGPDADYDPNTPCTAWGREGLPNWQVSWGIYPYQWVDRIPEAIAVMRPEKSIREIGQEVIDNSYDINRYATFNNPHEKDPIINPKIFPDLALEEIVEGAKPVGVGDRSKSCRPEVDRNSDPTQDPKDCSMRQLLGILLKDPAISAYFLALNWKDVFDNQLVASEIQRQGGYDPQIASNIIAGFDNESRGIDFEALITTPQISIPVATLPALVEDPTYPIHVETVVSQDGIAMDDQEINARNQKREIIILPNGVSPIDFSPSVSDVRGVSTIEEVSIDPTISANPENYQLCALLKTVDYNVVTDAKCLPMSQIIHPQTPLDLTVPQALLQIPSSPAEEDIYKSQFPIETETLSCEPRSWQDEQPYSCENGYACYNRWKISGNGQCSPEPDYGDDGNWYECFKNEACNSPEE